MMMSGMEPLVNFAMRMRRMPRLSIMTDRCFTFSAVSVGMASLAPFQKARALKRTRPVGSGTLNAATGNIPALTVRLDV